MSNDSIPQTSPDPSEPSSLNASDFEISSPPPVKARPRTTLFSRLRRPYPPAPMNPNSHLASAEIISEGKKEKRKSKWETRASRKPPPPPVPRSNMDEERNELGPALSRVSARFQVEDDEEGLEWERIKTLPRVRLVPPEDEGEPILLYPPPRLTQPESSTSLAETLTPNANTEPQHHSNQYYQSQASTSKDNQSIKSFSTSQWAGMEKGFIKPPEKFRRGMRGPGVIMPKRKDQVLGERERERRMSRAYSGHVEHEQLGLTEEVVNDSGGELVGEVALATVGFAFHEAEGTPKRDVPVAILPALSEEDEETTFQPNDEQPSPPIEPRSSSTPTALSETSTPLSPSSPPTVASSSVSSFSPPVAPPKPIPVIESHSARKRRAMSLTSALAAKIQPVIPHEESLPPLPLPSNEGLRRQKSIKKFSFAHTDDPPVPPKHKEKKRMLSRAKSKPSLRIDVKASRGPDVPGPATASSSGQSDAYPDTPRSIPTPGLSKRFSLSNMSQAFKKSKHHVVAVPTVPELPEAYRKEKEKSNSDNSNPERSLPTAELQSPPDLPRLVEAALIKSSPVAQSPTWDISAVNKARCQPIIQPEIHVDDTSDTSSILSDTSDLEAEHAQLMHVSPRTQRNPSRNLQEFLGTGPEHRVGAVVEANPDLSRRSVEAIVLGPLLADLPSPPQNNRSDSLESLSRSSTSSEVDLPPITPAIPQPNPLSPPLSLALDAEHDIVLVDSPTTSTRTSTPKNRFGSPEAFLRKLGSPLSRHVHVHVPTVSVRETVQYSSIPIPPIPADDSATTGYNTLAGEVQLKSLHFESLGFNFGDFTWPAERV